jgi:hypothetical protein
MSSIKPPDGRGKAEGLPVGPEQGASGPAAADFREALAAEGARAQGATAPQSAQGAAAAAGSDPIAELAGLVKTGALTADEALEQLVERALGRVGRGLSEGQRGELVTVLRTALESDPTLRALREGLAR